MIDVESKYSDIFVYEKGYKLFKILYLFVFVLGDIGEFCLSVLNKFGKFKLLGLVVLGNVFIGLNCCFIVVNSIDFVCVVFYWIFYWMVVMKCLEFLWNFVFIK